MEKPEKTLWNYSIRNSHNVKQIANAKIKCVLYIIDNYCKDIYIEYHLLNILKNYTFSKLTESDLTDEIAEYKHDYYLYRVRESEYEAHPPLDKYDLIMESIFCACDTIDYNIYDFFSNLYNAIEEMPQYYIKQLQNIVDCTLA